MMMLWLLCALNATLTPGVARHLSVHEICSTKWGHDRRHVTTAMKQEVANRYGVPWSKHADYEFDHLIPRELGGADDVNNLWPQPWADARKKDQLETRLHVLVCSGQLPLEQAQASIRRDWREAYRKYIDGR